MCEHRPVRSIDINEHPVSEVSGVHVAEKRAMHENRPLQKPAPAVILGSARPGDVYHMLRSVTDFVSGLTDRHALSLYRKIKGISL